MIDQTERMVPSLYTQEKKNCEGGGGNTIEFLRVFYLKVSMVLLSFARTFLIFVIVVKDFCTCRVHITGVVHFVFPCQNFWEFLVYMHFAYSC